MSDPIVLTVPDEITARARQIADTSDQSVEQVLIDHLRTLHAPLPALTEEQQAEIDALAHLSDDALWTIARDHLPGEVEARAHHLMAHNNDGTITPEERSELERLVERADRLMLRKAEAASLLRQRGHAVDARDITLRND